ncbi:hypothetical protein AB0I81_29765 [Nonomuraea sp. NPDC050404]|uniref:hypothetical protein n=1 Tax=Nonomuraea sp. NPDC050404 TaxID=3155783 RepID=UPI003408AFE8
MDANPTDILHDLLRARGLSVAQGDGTTVVGNPLHPLFSSVLTTVNGRYLTGYGYELGEQGDEVATADRFAFLLGAPAMVPPPSGGRTSPTEVLP